jgi:hypothetical protein
MTTLPKLPEPEIIGVAGFCDDGIGYTEAKMLAFQAATVEAIAKWYEDEGWLCDESYIADMIRAMLKEKTE